MNVIDSVVLAISDILYQPWCVPLILIGGAIYLSFRCGFLQFGMFRESCKVIMEKPHEGGVSSFGALMVSTASRVGTGNIIGVSMAIVCGGPGAIFWMWITAFFGGASAFVESTLAQIFKKKDGPNASKGGPAFYMRDALGQRWLGVIFSCFIIFTYMIGYNMLAAYNLQSTFSVFRFYNEKATPIIIGLILMILFGVVVFGGFGPVFICIAMIFFAFTTLIGNYSYCEGCFEFIIDREAKEYELKVMRVIASVLIFLGAVASAGLVWHLADLAQALMVITNVPSIIILGKIAFKCLDDYKAQMKEGKNPVFKASNIGLKQETDFWN